METPTRQQRRAAEREKKTEKAKQDKALGNIVGGRVDGKAYHQWPAWEGQGVPLRENCDLDNPRQKFLWMFTAMPGMRGAPLMMPAEYWEMQSWRMCVLGADVVNEPTQKWQAPVNTVNPHMAAGQWVDLDAAEPERKTLADMVRELPQKDRADIRAAVLEQMGLEDDGDRPGPPAMQYTVTTLAERLDTSVPELLDFLANIGVTNLHADSRVGRDVADRIAARMGL
jgi:hypothetical protein